jgi:hypothetical protein
MTASELKYRVEAAGNERYFFTRKTMRFFGDTMKNYGVRRAVVDTREEKAVNCWELYRRRPVMHGLKSSAFFRDRDYSRVFPA